MKPDYLVWETAEVPHAYVLHAMSKVERRWQIPEGVPRLASWPDDVTYSVDPDFPHDTLLIDSFETRQAMTIVSPKLRAVVEEHGAKNVEFLPIAILDHKNRKTADYFIIHPVHPVDALDFAASGAEWSIADDSWIGKIDKIVFDQSKVDPDLQIFKFKSLYKSIIVRRDLAQAMDAAGLTGIEWTELEDFSQEH